MDKILKFGIAGLAIAGVISLFAMRRKRAEQYSAELPKSMMDACPPLDDDGKHRIDRKGLDILEECISKIPQTKTLHTVNGKYTPEREVLHGKIIQHEIDINKECIERTQPIAIFTGGVFGAGKSTFIRKNFDWLGSSKVFMIDADKIRTELPEYEGWNATLTVDETKDIVNDLLDTIGSPCQYDLIYDGTMKNPDKYIPIIEKLREFGYKIFIIYVDIPPEESWTRTLKRYRDNSEHRYVPRAAILKANKVGIAGFDNLKTLVDGWVMADGVTSDIIDTGGEEIPLERYYYEPGEEILRKTYSAGKKQVTIDDNTWNLVGGYWRDKKKGKDDWSVPIIVTEEFHKGPKNRIEIGYIVEDDSVYWDGGWGSDIEKSRFDNAKPGGIWEYYKKKHKKMTDAELNGFTGRTYNWIDTSDEYYSAKKKASGVPFTRTR